MKKVMFIAMILSIILITGCEKFDEDPGLNQQVAQDLKHSPNPIPLNGGFEGFLSTVATCDAPWMGRVFEGSGNVTHLGNTDCELNYCVKLEYPSPDPGIDGIFNGPGVLTAANGDQLNGYFNGTLTMVWDGATIIGATIDAEGIFIGGTGQLEEAYGFVHGTGYLDYAAGGGVAGDNIPATLEFSGFMLYGAELFDVTVSGMADYSGSCPDGGNAYTWTGPGTGTLGNVDFTSQYCGYTTIMQLAPPYPPITIPIGGTIEGTGYMEDSDGNELFSEYAGTYRFTYEPFLPYTTNLHNDYLGSGTISGGTGDLDGAYGKFLLIGTQDIPFSPSGAQFPAPGSMHLVGYIFY